MIDKTKPNIIPVHKLNPDLAKEIIRVADESKELDTKAKQLTHLMELNEAQRTVLWDKISEAFRDDLKVISPNNKLRYILHPPQ